jgi:hypothetical protein
MWHCRSAPAVKRAFASIWGTADLVTSFDGMCVPALADRRNLEDHTQLVCSFALAYFHFPRIAGVEASLQNGLQQNVLQQCTHALCV